MQSLVLVRKSDVVRTSRVLQMEGMFDVPPSERSEVSWTFNIELPSAWNVGLIVGPSGSGKSTVARELFGAAMVDGFEWSTDRSILDGFPAGMSIKEITALLSSVGFSSPPAWVRPFHALSNGEQFRVTTARALAERKGLCVMDEFTSVVDRTVAKIGSAAVAKTVRRSGGKFVAVSCHFDIAEWMEPDWVFQPHTGELQLPRGSLRRPPINLEIFRVHPSAWSLFHRHHYMTSTLHKGALCLCAFWEGRPVAFSAWLPFVGKLPNGARAMRCSRLVCLPDFQGVGIGNRFLSVCASLWSAIGRRVFVSTGHHSFVRSLHGSADWRMTKAPAFSSPDGGKTGKVGTEATRCLTRMTASFEYRGKPADPRTAHGILNA
jgi:ABC-type lipoprotein export system ATPase subunit